MEVLHSADGDIRIVLRCFCYLFWRNVEALRNGSASGSSINITGRQLLKNFRWIEHYLWRHRFLSRRLIFGSSAYGLFESFILMLVSNGMCFPGGGRCFITISLALLRAVHLDFFLMCSLGRGEWKSYTLFKFKLPKFIGQ
jgi:hypothetical protein